MSSPDHLSAAGAAALLLHDYLTTSVTAEHGNTRPSCGTASSCQKQTGFPGGAAQTMEAVQRAGQQSAGMPSLRTLSMDGNKTDIEVGWPVTEPPGGEGDVRASKLPGGLAGCV